MSEVQEIGFWWTHLRFWPCRGVRIPHLQAKSQSQVSGRPPLLLLLFENKLLTIDSLLARNCCWKIFSDCSMGPYNSIDPIYSPWQWTFIAMFVARKIRRQHDLPSPKQQAGRTKAPRENHHGLLLVKPHGTFCCGKSHGKSHVPLLIPLLE